MKKFTLLFLALSSLTFAAASTSGTKNENPTTSSTKDTAGININVSAFVTSFTETQLTIDDENGVQISTINFHHELNQNPDTFALNGNISLNTTIYAKAPGLTAGRESTITTSTLEPFEVDNFYATVSTEKKTIETNKGLPFILTSLVNASPTGALTPGETINTTSQILTFTYDKTK